MRRRRGHQRGSAMLVTLIIIGALIAGAGVLVSLQLASNRSSDLTKSGMSALYCAEAGLAAARPVVTNHYADWASAIAAFATDPNNPLEPAWLSTDIGSHDIDGQPGDDFMVYIKDNADEVPNDMSKDNDLQIFIVSKCLRYPDTPVQVEELVLFNGGTTCIPTQGGGQDNNGNKNDGC